MLIEAHDAELDNTDQGTLTARAGGGGTIEYTYQGEMYVQEMLQDFESARRFYAYDYGIVWAVWSRNEQGEVHYVARNSGYSGQWELPYLYPNASSIVVGILGRTVQTFQEGVAWAAQELQSNVGTVVLMDNEGVVAAWEKGPDGPTLIAKSFRPLQKIN